MSIKIMSTIWERGPENQSERFVLLALADYSNDEGECWPSIAGIADKTCLTTRGVQKVIRRLQDSGWLEIVEGGGRKNCHLYRIKTLNAVHPERGSPLNVVPKKGERGSENPERGSPEPSITIIEPSLSDNARDGFDEFWSMYPRKVGKGDARKAYAKAVKVADHDDIMFGLSQQMPAFGEKPQQYIPHPSTWLNAERWNDDPEQIGNRNGRGIVVGGAFPGGRGKVGGIAGAVARRQLRGEAGGDVCDGGAERGNDPGQRASLFGF